MFSQLLHIIEGLFPWPLLKSQNWEELSSRTSCNMKRNVWFKKSSNSVVLHEWQCQIKSLISALGKFLSLAKNSELQRHSYYFPPVFKKGGYLIIVTVLPVKLQTFSGIPYNSYLFIAFVKEISTYDLNWNASTITTPKLPCPLIESPTE